MGYWAKNAHILRPRSFQNVHSDLKSFMGLRAPTQNPCERNANWAEFKPNLKGVKSRFPKGQI